MTSGADASTGGMKGEGYYDAHSEYQRRVIEGGDELIQSAVTGARLEGATAFTICDYGAGTGATSVHAMRTAIAAVRARDADLPLMAIHNDVASNDFTQLFANVAGGDGYLGLEGGPIYAAAAAGSFFGQVIPSGYAHLGMCSNAAHWLRGQPDVSTPEGMYFCEATGPARAELAERAAGDWLSFLEARAAELVPGGRMVVQGIASTDDGSQVSASRLLAVMWAVAKQLAEEGRLDPAVLDAYVFPVYCRSPEEATAPLAEGAPLHGVFEVVEQRIDEVPSPYWEAYERDGDAAAYAKTYVEFVRAFAESTLLAHLFEPGASGVDASALCEEYFERLEAAAAEDPEAGRYEAWILRLVLERD